MIKTDIKQFRKKIKPINRKSIKDHYEYTHFDPDEGCLMIIEGQKTVRLFDSTEVMKMSPNKRGSFGRTVQSQGWSYF